VDKVDIRYLREIGKYPLLNEDDERELSKRAAEGDQAAKELFINSNLRIVVARAKKFSNLGTPIMDLIANGNLGLIEAVNRYQPNDNNKFYAFGIHWVDNYIRRALRDNEFINLPACSYNQKVKMRSAAYMYRAEHDREPDFETMVALTQLNRETVYRLMYSGSVISYHNIIGKESDSRDFLSYFTTELSDQEVSEISEYQRYFVDAVMSRLDPEEKQVIVRKYGLDGDDPLSFKDCAKALLIPVDRVRFLHRRVLKRIKLELGLTYENI
jgi:RNA polymerase primary sigma factor